MTNFIQSLCKAFRPTLIVFSYGLLIFLLLVRPVFVTSVWYNYVIRGDINRVENPKLHLILKYFVSKFNRRSFEVMR